MRKAKRGVPVCGSTYGSLGSLQWASTLIRTGRMQVGANGSLAISNEACRMVTT